jgi:hypothetical protein
MRDSLISPCIIGAGPIFGSEAGRLFFSFKHVFLQLSLSHENRKRRSFGKDYAPYHLAPRLRRPARPLTLWPEAQLLLDLNGHRIDCAFVKAPPKPAQPETGLSASQMCGRRI